MNVVVKAAGNAAQVLGVMEWYNDLNLVRIYNHLYFLVGGDYKLMHHWMQTPNSHLDGKVPSNLIVNSEGEKRVLNYLENYTEL